MVVRSAFRPLWALNVEVFWLRPWLCPVSVTPEGVRYHIHQAAGVYPMLSAYGTVALLREAVAGRLTGLQ